MYLVYTTRRNNRTEVLISNEEQEVFGITVRQQEETHHEHDILHRQKVSTFMFNGRRAEIDATAAARIIAAECPGEDVYIAKIVQVVSGVRPEVVVKSVSERGVLPA